MSNINFKALAKRAGLPVKVVMVKYDQALADAKVMGMENNQSYVLEILNSLLGLNEEDLHKTIVRINNDFLNSGYSRLSEYLEAVVNDNLQPMEELMSVGFLGDASAVNGTTPTENPIAKPKIDPLSGLNPKNKAKDHIKTYGPGKLGQTDAEKHAIDNKIKLIKKKPVDPDKKNKDDRSEKNRDVVLKKADAEPVKDLVDTQESVIDKDFEPFIEIAKEGSSVKTFHKAMEVAVPMTVFLKFKDVYGQDKTLYESWESFVTEVLSLKEKKDDEELEEIDSVSIGGAPENVLAVTVMGAGNGEEEEEEEDIEV